MGVSKESARAAATITGRLVGTARWSRIAAAEPFVVVKVGEFTVFAWGHLAEQFAKLLPQTKVQVEAELEPVTWTTGERHARYSVKINATNMEVLERP